MSKNAGQAISGGCLALFGLPFLGAGLFVLFLAVGSWQLYFESAGWGQVPAEILAAELRTSRGSKGSTTYSVVCRYRYVIDGKAYESDRVGLQSGTSTNDRGFHERQFADLEAARVGKTSWPALVDPSDPSRSILSREVDVTLYILPPFGLVFATVGGGLMLLGISSARGIAKKVAVLGRDPGRPWLAEPRWTGFVISASTRGKVLGLWGMGVFMALFLSVFLIALSADPHAPYFAWGIVGLFCVADVAILVQAVYLTLQYLKYGTPRLRLAQLPFVPGGPFKALLVLDRALAPEGSIDCALICSQTTRSGKSSQTQVLFKESVAIDPGRCEFGFNNASIPIELPIPEGAPPRQDELGDWIKWALTVHAATPGVDFSVTFDDLPVYRVADAAQVQQGPRLDRS